MRQILCADCTTLVAEIAEGSKLRKDIVCYCAPCSNKLNRLAAAGADVRRRAGTGPELPKEFADIFKMGKK